MNVIQREQRVISGRMFEAEFYPVTQNGARLSEGKSRRSDKAAQDKYNRRRAIKEFVRKINCNFDNSDYYMTPTYRPDKAPESIEKAERDIKNYIRRIKYARANELERKKAELSEVRNAKKASGANRATALLEKAERDLKKKIKKLSEPLKYAYAIEASTYKRGESKGKMNYHFHMFITGGLDRQEMERIFGKGMRVSCDTYKPEMFGPEAAALYISKDPRGKKSFVCSKNMLKPKKLTPRDGKITARGVEKLAKERIDDAKYWENRYAGYKFLRCYSRYNPYNGYYYVSVVMFKTDGDAPPFMFTQHDDEIFMI